MRRAAVGIGNIHHDMYMCKEPCRTSALTGQAWVTELEGGNPKRMYQSFRMSKINFFSFVYQLEHNYGLQVSKRISVAKQVAIFFWIMGQRANNRYAQEHFQYSGETTSRQFHNVLHALNAMAIDWVALVSATMAIHNFIRRKTFLTFLLVSMIGDQISYLQIVE
ncbi:hypothetical protein RHMOL_Rhmol07G0227000 [Rhododendron molle]|uniref:Uncharacterized protein n=1 Tax=Rhododendron molle TaxID=49168 RepID=A0ACC0N5A0_RHOML|nr:hypothetical protein RHMOL_Rhmol07G0227000 [Rhododendron molle]